MAFPTSVNSQITDAVTQANTKVLGDAPAIAMGNLFIATSQALSNAAHNAAMAQQNSTTISQAATTQAVATLLSIDTAPPATGIAAMPITHVQAAAVGGAVPEAAANAAPDEAQAQLEQALEFADKLVFDSAAPWANAAHEIMKALAEALHDLQHMNQETNMAIVKQAALASTLSRMILVPDQFDQYQKIIELIKTL
jgi:hypothetical protein